jgi:hypothetical protein
MNSAEVLASGDSIRGDISRDGRIVVFDSLAKTSLAHSGSGLALTHSRAHASRKANNSESFSPCCGRIFIRSSTMLRRKT